MKDNISITPPDGETSPSLNTNDKTAAPLIPDGEVMEIVRLAGLLILENGGETFRAEETVYRICAACGYENADVFALPTGLLISLGKGSDIINTAVVRVKKRTINLTKIEKVNDVSRALARHNITAAEAMEKLKRQNCSSAVNKLMYAAFAGMSTGLFTLLYGGGLFDCVVAFLCGAVVQYVSSLFRRTDIFRFVISIMGGIIIAALAVTAVTVFNRGDIEKIIIGGMIPLLPGLAMTNAIRDTMMGDLVSGSARLTEVLLIALALASGVGIVFSAFIAFGGAL